MLDLVSAHLPAIRALCQRHGVKRLELFGSAACGDFDPGRSDLDFVVEFFPSPSRGLDDPYFQLLLDLEALFGRKVDLVMSGAIRNPYFRASIESTKVPLYAAA
jgi:uncharacterized protein